MKIGAILILIGITAPIGSILQSIGLIKMGIQFNKFRDDLPSQSGFGKTFNGMTQHMTTQSNPTPVQNQYSPNLNIPQNNQINQESSGREFLKKRLLGYLRLHKKIKLSEAAELFDITTNDLKLILYEFAGEDIIQGRFTEYGYFILE